MKQHPADLPNPCIFQITTTVPGSELLVLKIAYGGIAMLHEQLTTYDNYTIAYDCCQ